MKQKEKAPTNFVREKSVFWCAFIKALENLQYHKQKESVLSQENLPVGTWIPVQMQGGVATWRLGGRLCYFEAWVYYFPAGWPWAKHPLCPAFPCSVRWSSRGTGLPPGVALRLQ